MTSGGLRFLKVGEDQSARDIAIRCLTPGEGKPVLVWLGGYRSDMLGTKAVELEAYALENNFGCLRFDYSAHGESSGDFKDGTISRWLEDTLAVIADSGFTRLVLVGSSMGGWIAIRALQELKACGARGAVKIDGMVLIAPAPDFTQDLVEPALSDAERTSLKEKGYFEERSEYSPEPNIFTAALLEDGRKNQVLTGMIETGCPVHILQGMKDPDVPWKHAMKLVEHLPADDVVISLIKDGDHRLSRPQDLELMRRALDQITHG
jgi:pimeloyl-ACP methyl ester carboxylesterase